MLKRLWAWITGTGNEPTTSCGGSCPHCDLKPVEEPEHQKTFILDLWQVDKEDE